MRILLNCYTSLQNEERGTDFDGDFDFAIATIDQGLAKSIVASHKVMLGLKVAYPGLCEMRFDSNEEIRFFQSWPMEGPESEMWEELPKDFRILLMNLGAPIIIPDSMDLSVLGKPHPSPKIRGDKFPALETPHDVGHLVIGPVTFRWHAHALDHEFTVATTSIGYDVLQMIV